MYRRRRRYSRKRSKNPASRWVSSNLNRPSNYRRAPYTRIRTLMNRFVKQSNSMYFNAEEYKYIMACTNPFYRFPSGGYAPVGGARIPDPCAPITAPFTFTHTMVINSSTYVNLFKISLPSAVDSDMKIIRWYAAQGSYIPTAHTFHYFPSWATIRSYVESYRIVGIGLKVIPISSVTDTSGTLKAGNTQHTGGPSTGYITMANAYNDMDDTVYTTQDGITVRYMPSGPSSYEFYKMLPAKTNDWDKIDDTLPTIFLDLGKTDTKVQVMGIIHLECTMDRNYQFGMSPSPISPKWPICQSLATSYELSPEVVKGHSFRTFFKKVGSFLWKLASGIARYTPIIGNVVRSVENAVRPPIVL